jgi:hypothetical protein
MPSTTVPGFLYDGRGNQVPFVTGGALYARSLDDDRLRPRARNHFADYIDLLSTHRFRELVSEDRALASHGQPAALLEQKSDYVAASHFRPQFRGQDSEYGRTSLPLIESALRICNVRGPLYTWKTTWRLLVPTLATDGQVYVLLTRWGETRQPALQILEAHRIGQRDASSQRVGNEAVTTIVAADGSTSQIRGAYRGLRIVNGHIYNREGTEVAYRVLGAADDGSEDMDISARDLYRVARPKSYSEGRTPPEMAASAMDFIALNLAWEAQLDQQIIDSRLTLIEKNASGKYDAGAGFGGGINGQPQGTAAGTPTTIDERGMTRIIKTGHSLEAHETTRPSDQWMNFQATGQARGAAGLRWRAEMLDPSSLKGGATRLFQDQVNTLIQESFSTADQAAERALRYFVACLSGPDLGVLPLHAEAGEWGIAPPPWVEVDRASARYDLEDVAAGRTPMSVLHARDGHATAEVYSARARAYEEALAIQERHPKVPLDIILGDLGVTATRSGFFPQTDPVPDPTVKQPAPAKP